MQFAVTFRHMEPTEALKSYARERMERVRKYLPDPIACHVVLSTEGEWLRPLTVFLRRRKR